MAAKEKPATKRSAKKDAARKAAEEDARGMLLAAGHEPDDEEYVAALLAEPPGPPAQAFTIPEFCSMWKCSRATYDRRRALGQTPTETIRWGKPMITQKDIDEWQAGLEKREAEIEAGAYLPPKRRRRKAPPPLAPEEGGPMTPQSRRKPRNGEDKRESLFDPPLPKHLRVVRGRS